MDLSQDRLRNKWINEGMNKWINEWMMTFAMSIKVSVLKEVTFCGLVVCVDVLKEPTASSVTVEDGLTLPWRCMQYFPPKCRISFYLSTQLRVQEDSHFYTHGLNSLKLHIVGWQPRPCDEFPNHFSVPSPFMEHEFSSPSSQYPATSPCPQSGKCIHTNQSYYINMNKILLPSHLRLDLQSCLCPLVFL
jgi:hypothetical protein